MWEWNSPVAFTVTRLCPCATTGLKNNLRNEYNATYSTVLTLPNNISLLNLQNLRPFCDLKIFDRLKII